MTCSKIFFLFKEKNHHVLCTHVRVLSSKSLRQLRADSAVCGAVLPLRYIITQLSLYEMTYFHTDPARFSFFHLVCASKKNVSQHYLYLRSVQRPNLTCKHIAQLTSSPVCLSFLSARHCCLVLCAFLLAPVM